MLPYLFYDTAISHELLSNNRQYRNAGDLLVTTCPSVQNALRLCGAEERILGSEGSDLERFTAICYAMPYLYGHPVRLGIERILTSLGIYSELAPYSVEELWQEINSVIEEKALTPVSLLTQMNVESVSVRTDPFTEAEKTDNGLDIYNILDLKNVSELIVSSNNTAADLNSFIAAITDAIGHTAVRLTLDKHYRYERCSRRVEIEGFYNDLANRKKLKTEEINALITYIFVELAKSISTSALPLILRVDCDCDELNMLYSYLSLNHIYPQTTVLICRDPKSFEAYAVSHTKRTPIGMPSIIIVNQQYDGLFKAFPSGFALQYQEGICDVAGISATIAEADRLIDIYGEDVGEGMIYGNIKNIFHI